MKPGQRSYVPGIGYIAIVSVEPVKLKDLTDADAELDGFPTADMLRKEIRALYTADMRKTLTPYRVRFSVYPPGEQQRMKRERQRQKQQKNLRYGRDTRQQEFIIQALAKLRSMSEK